MHRASLLAFLVACGGRAAVDGGAGGGPGTGGSSSTDVAVTSTTVASGTGGSGGCRHDMPPPGMLCVRGEPTPDGSEVLTPDAPVRVEVAPYGCFSSSCTTVHEASCMVERFSPPALVATASFCIEDTSEQMGGCTADCGGAGAASCFTEPLSAGGYSVTLGELTVLFTLPMTTPPGGACVGALF